MTTLKYMPVATVDVLPVDNGFSIGLLKGKKLVDVPEVLKTYTETRQGQKMTFLFILCDSDGCIVEKRENDDDVFFNFKELQQCSDSELVIREAKGTLDSAQCMEDNSCVVFFKLSIDSENGLYESIDEVDHVFARMIANAQNRHGLLLRTHNVVLRNLDIHSKVNPSEFS